MKCGNTTYFPLIPFLHHILGIKTFRSGILSDKILSTQRAPAFACVACLDDYDEQRVCCAYMSGNVMFTCYGDYEDAVRKTWNDILKIYWSL